MHINFMEKICKFEKYFTILLFIFMFFSAYLTVSENCANWKYK